MAGGLFELRRDDITGWWVAVVVDREFERERFALPARRVATPDESCQNCTSAPAERAWVRTLKPQAFTVAGGEREARERHGRARGPATPREPAAPRAAATAREAPTAPAVAGAQDPERRPAGSGEREVREQRLGLLGDVGSWKTIAAPRGHHGSLADEAEGTVIELLRLARAEVEEARGGGETDYLQVVQNWGAQAGARTNHLCLDLYDLPHIPHRIGEELGGAARYVIREGVCPWCRLVQDEVARRERLVFEDAASVCFAPYASRSPFELWVVPRHHEADFGRATDEQLTSAGGTLQKVVRLLRVLDGPAYNLVLHTAPLHERVDETYHWHWEIHPRLRDIAGLELGTGLPVNPVSPEEAVEELLAPTRAATGQGAEGGPGRRGGPGEADKTETAASPAGSERQRTWDDFPRG